MRRLDVGLRRTPGDVLPVGTLAEQDRRLYFEYAGSFVETALELSPFELPLRAGLIEHTDRAFGPLPGLFDDSLPDGWGRLLMDRHFRRQGIDPATVSPLDRLAWLGTRTMGALVYHPPMHEDEANGGERLVDLNALGRHAEAVLDGDAVDVLPALTRAGGSPGGARPKVLVGVLGERIVSGEDDLDEAFVEAGGEHWIVKFAAREEATDAGSVEYAYSLMARAAGITMPPTRLFEAGTGRDRRRHFGVRRFDRPRDDGSAPNRRVHVHTFANLIHADFRLPSTDYGDLFEVSRALTGNHADLLRLFRLMLFNVATHNRDDHAKNFAFVLDERRGEWSLAPAYDLTCSDGPGGEHSSTVLGEGRRPTLEHCLALAGRAGIRPRESRPIVAEVDDAVRRWRGFADEAGCSRAITASCETKMTSLS